MEKVKVSSETLLKYLTDHNVKLARLAELMGISGASLTSCFKHQIINKGVPRQFTAQNLERMNEALPQLASELRGSMLIFGTGETRTGQKGKVYDSALVDQMKRIGQYMNLTALVYRVLGWSQDKKESILVTKNSKVHGNITREDADLINTELLSVAGVLSSYEVIANNNK